MNQPLVSVQYFIVYLKRTSRFVIHVFQMLRPCSETDGRSPGPVVWPGPQLLPPVETVPVYIYRTERPATVGESPAGIPPDLGTALPVEWDLSKLSVIDLCFV